MERTMEKTHKAYIPAAGRDLFLPLYDPIAKLFGGDRAKRDLIQQAALPPGARVLDIGCGTGTLAVLIKRLHPDAEVTGLDPDPKALARARAKAERAGVVVRFDQGFADDLPYQDGSFDRVFSSFMLHHLELRVKEGTLAEVCRVLKPGGSLHLLDFGGPKSTRGGLLSRLIHSSEILKDNFDDRIIALMGAAGLADAREVDHRATIFGQIAFYQASRPVGATT